MIAAARSLSIELMERRDENSSPYTMLEKVKNDQTMLAKENDA